MGNLPLKKLFRKFNEHVQQAATAALDISVHERVALSFDDAIIIPVETTDGYSLYTAQSSAEELVPEMQLAVQQNFRRTL